MEEEAGFPRSADAAAPPVDTWGYWGDKDYWRDREPRQADPPTGFPFDLDPPSEAEADLEEDQKMLKGYNNKPAAANAKEPAPNAIK